MTNTINEYSSGIALPQYITTDYNNDLEVALLLKKQHEYDTTLQRLDNLQSSALNISMINKKGKEKLDQYNSELDDLLSQDLGDLTDPRVQAQVAGYFTKIATDEDLKERSKLSQHYITQNQIIERERQRAMKDPSKSGYSKVNEFVYKGWEGGEYDFMQADDIERWNQKMQSYTPFRDINTKMVNLTKLLHEETKSYTQSDNQGRLISVTTEGVTPERIRALMQATLTQDEMDQLEVLSKYQILTTGKDSLYESYNNWISANQKSNDSSIRTYQAYIEQYDSKNIPTNLPESEKKVKEAEFQAKQQYYQGLLEQANRSKQRIATDLMKTPEEWGKMGNTDLLPLIQQQMFESKVSDVSNALSYMSQVEKVSVDQADFMAKRLRLDTSIAEHNMQMDQLELQLKEQEQLIKAGKIPGGSPDSPGWSNPATQTSDPQQGALRFQEMIEENKSLKSKTHNIFEDPSIATSPEKLQSLLNSKEFKERYQDNGYLKMWDQYTLYSDTPTVEGFKVFMKSVEEGNYSHVPAIQGNYDQLNRDKQVFEFQTSTINDIQEKAYQSSGKHPLDVTLSENGPSLRKYMNSNGKFGIPTSPKVPGQEYTGGFKQMTWDEVKEQYKKEKDSYFTDSISGDTKQSIFINDPYFMALVSEAVKQDEVSSKGLVKAFNETLPTYAQYAQRNLEMTSDTNKEYAQKNVIPYINESYRIALTDGTTRPFNITTSDIDMISLSTSGNTGSFVLSKKGKENLKGGTLLDANGNRVSIDEATMGRTEFKFNFPNPDKYDFMYNQMFQKQNYLKDSHKGHTIEYKRVDTDPNNVMIIVKAPNGEVIRSTTPYVQDLTSIRSKVKGIIDQRIISTTATTTSK